MSDRTNPTTRLYTLAEQLETRFAAQGCTLHLGIGELTLIIPSQELLVLAACLRDEDPFQFTQLIDLCGIDYATYGQSEWATLSATTAGFGRGVECSAAGSWEAPQRFAVVYHLLSLTHNIRLRCRVYVPEDTLILDSVYSVWAAANWFEREAFDLYGILFRGHPDLRRILTDYDFVGYPLRKDFPLIGQVEMRYDPAQQRVIYEPVAITPRTLVPRVIRSDNRYLRDEMIPPPASSSK